MAGPLLLLLLVAACTAELGFQPKRQYTYLYEAKQASGIPGLQSQWSALGMKMKVTIQVPTGDGDIYFKLDSLQQGELNNVYTHQPWRKNFSIPYSPVQQHQEVLSRVFKVHLTNGVITKLVTSADEPIWVVNIKKSIAQMFQLDLQKHHAIDVPSMAQPRNYQSGQQAEFFRVMEDSIGGECETLYETTPRLPQDIKADILQELTILSQSSLSGIEVPQFDRFQPFIVTKTKNYQNCKSRPNWQHMTPGAMSCRSDDCYLTASNRSASARYVLDGDRDSFRIQYVLAESATVTSPCQYETEQQLWTATNQTLFLMQVKSMGSFFGEPQHPSSYGKLAFQYPTADGQELRMPDLKSAPQLSTSVPGAPVKLIQSQAPPDQLITTVVSLIQKVDQLLYRVPDADQDVTGNVVELERAISWLSYDQLDHLYGRLTGPDQKDIYWDILALVGTNPAVMKIMNGIHTRSIEESRAVSILATLPINIKTPTYELTEKIFELLKSPVISSQTRMTMALSLGNIFYQVCISNTTVEHSYTQGLYQKDFCSRQTKSLLKEQFIPFLERKIDETQEPEKLAYIQALGNTGDKKTSSILSRLVTTEKSPLVATKAIYAFYRVALQDPEEVRKILSPIFHDLPRDTNVRLAAVSQVLATNPPIEYWQKFATSTWYEPSDTVAAVIHSTYDTLANITETPVPRQFEMSRRARITLPLIRPPQGGFGFSGSYNYHSAQSIPQYQMAFLTNLGIIASNTSVIPSAIYMDFQKYINSILYSNQRSYLNVQGGQKLIEKIMGVITDSSYTHQSPRDIGSRFRQLGSIERSQKQSEAFLAIGHIQVMGLVDYMYMMDEQSLNALVRKIGAGGTTPANKMQKIQKIAYLEDTTVTFASEIGMPTIYSKKTPMVASVRGKISAQWSWTTGQYHLSTENVQPFIAVKNLVTIGTVSPFSLRTLGAGVENKVQVSLPMSLEVKLDLHSKMLQAKVETVQQPSLVKVAHIRTVPFTTAVKVTSYESLVTSPDTKEITVPRKTELKLPFGQDFGVDGYLRLVSDDPIVNFGTFWREMRRRRNAGITNFWFMMGSLRSRHYDIVVDTAKSRFQKLETTFKIISTDSQDTQEMTQPIVTNQQHTSQIRSTIQKTRMLMQGQQWNKPLVSQQQMQTMRSKSAYVAVATITQKDRNMQHYKSHLTLMADPKSNVPYPKQLYIVDFSASSPTNQVCLTGSLDVPELSDNRAKLLNTNIEADVSAEFGYGSQCQHRLSVSGRIRRDEVAKEYARNCPEAQRCVEHESLGNPNSADCRLAKDYAAIANHYSFEFTGYSLTEAFQKASYALEFFVKYHLWQDMSTELFVQNKKNKVKITMQLDPLKNGMSLNISTPSENIKFDSVPLPFNMLYEPGLITMRKSIRKKVVDSLYGVDKTVCIVDKNVVKTFDNVTLERQPSDCWTLLTADSTSFRKLAVYEKVVNQQSVIRIEVDDHKVEIDSSNLRQVKVDHQIKDLSSSIIIRDSASHKTLVKILKLAEDNIKVMLPEHHGELRVTREGVQIEASLLAYRNRMRGVCGDYDGEQRNDLVSLSGCIYKDGQKFYMSYRDDATRSQCRPQPPSPQECVSPSVGDSQLQGYYQSNQRY